jgi:hypothetical protein
MQPDLDIDPIQTSKDVFRYDPSDPESQKKLDRLLGEFGISLPEFLSNNFSQLIENLVWRKATSSIENDGGLALVVLLDLGEGDEVRLLTLRAGEINAFGHSELYAPSTL